MPLYRAIYIRGGKPRGVTFAYDSAEGAARWAERWIKNLQRYYPDAELLTVNFAKRRGGLSPADVARQGGLL